METRIGILGGSFNPPHKGHTFLAAYAKEACGLSKVIFIPTGKHAFDSKSGMTEAAHRMRMVELALRGNPSFEISDIEVRSAEKSYTYNTLTRLRKEVGDESRLCFITGTDEIFDIHRWYEWEKLLKEFEFIIAARPGVDLSAAEAKVKEYRSRLGADITLLKDIPAPDISSTEVRAFIEEIRRKLDELSEGQNAEACIVRKNITDAQILDTDNLPIEEEVLEYLLENNLYRDI